MTYLFLFFMMIFCSLGAHAETLTVPNVRVSVTGVSAAAARDQAIADGHRIAFQRALKQVDTEGKPIPPLPTDDEIMAMTKGFSVDKEKNTSTTYTALLSFQFDDGRLLRWVQNPPKQKADPTTQMADATLQIEPNTSGAQTVVTFDVPLTALDDLVVLENKLRSIPLVTDYKLDSFSRTMATIDLSFVGDMNQLQAALAQKAWTLNPNAEGRLGLDRVNPASQPLPQQSGGGAQPMASGAPSPAFGG